MPSFEQLDQHYGRVVGKVVFDIPPYLDARIIERVCSIKVNEPLTRQRVRHTLHGMYLIDEIENVTIQAKPMGDRLEVTVRIRPRHVLRDIEVTGNHVFSQRELLDDILHLEPGDDFRPELVDDYESKLEDAYSAVGRFDAEFKITWKLTERHTDNKADLFIDIKENAVYRVVKIDFSQGRLGAYPARKVLDEADLTPPFDFDQARIDRGLERLKKWLRKEGQLEARLPELSLDDPNAYTIDEEKHTVVVHFPLRVGPRVRIIYDEDCFTCGERKWNLDDVLGLENIRRFNRYVAQDFAKKVRMFLMRQGYYAAVVDFDYRRYTDPDGTLVREVRLRADRGPKVHIRKIEFLNNVIYNDATLRKLLTNRSIYVEEDFDKDLQNVINFYNAHGFLSARILQSSADFDEAAHAIDVTVDLEEGPQTMVHTIKYEGNAAIKTKDLKDALKEEPDSALVAGRPFNPFLLPKMKAVLLSTYLTHGYIKARVKEELKLSPDGKQADLVFHFTEGRQYFFGHVYYRGNRLTRKNIIERELVIVPGEPYDYERIIRSQQALIALGLFTNVDIRPISAALEDKDVDMLVEVKERKSGYITGGLGWNSYSGYNGTYEMGHRNLAGYGRRLGFRFEGTVNDTSFALDQSLFAVYFTWPWIARVPIDGSFTIRDALRHEIGYDDRSLGITFGTTLENRKLLNFLEATAKNPHTREVAGNVHTHRWFDPITSELDYSISRDYIFNLAKAVTNQTQGQAVVASISPMFTVDRRDDIFNPTRWSYNTLRFDYGTRWILSQVDYLRVTGRTSWYLPIYEWMTFLKGWVFAENVVVGHVQVLRASDSLPISQRFFLGGTTTIRGFAPNEIAPLGTDGRTPVGGYFMAYQNTEFRVPLTVYNLGLVFFLDDGDVTGGTNNFYLDRLRTSAGLGLALLTPVGPLAANYGFKLNRRHYESPGAFYISVGNTF